MPVLVCRGKRLIFDQVGDEGNWCVVTDIIATQIQTTLGQRILVCSH